MNSRIVRLGSSRDLADDCAPHAPAPLPLPPFWALQGIGWSAYYAVVAGARLDHPAVLRMAAWQGLYVVIGIALTMPLRALLRHMWRAERSLTARVTSSVAAAALLALVWSGAGTLAREPGLFQRVLEAPTRMNVPPLFVGAINDAMILCAWGFMYLALTHARELQRERLRSLRAESLAATSRLSALRYQLNPHLIFNTLNGISTLVLDNRPDEANQSILRLSAFLRTALRRDEVSIVSLADELVAVAQYLDIERARFGDRLAVVQQIDAAAYRARIPALLLQPLLENAIRHGRAGDGAVLTITLSARVIAERLAIAVTNTSTAGAGLLTTGLGIGLANVHERLAVHYGHEGSLRTTDGANEFLVEIEIPYLPGAATASRAAREHRSAALS